MMGLDADEKTEIRETAGGEFDGLTDEEVVFAVKEGEDRSEEHTSELQSR